MKAMILAGGFGTRLREVVRDVPKPMALIAGKPFLEHQIRWLREQGIEDIVLCVHYMADTIKSYFGNGKKMGVDITYSEEETPLGTAGAIKKTERYHQRDFLVLNGDSFSKIDLKSFLEFHASKRGIATMGLFNSPDTSHYGQVILNGDNVVDFIEKTKSQPGLINRGVYVFTPEIFDYMSPEVNSSLEREVFPRLANERRLFGCVDDGYFIDIGRPETYAQFKRDSLDDFMISPGLSVRDAWTLMAERGKESVLIVGPDKKLLGSFNDRIARLYLTQGGNIDAPVSQAMITDLEKVAREGYTEEQIHQMLLSGTRHLPVIDNQGTLVDIRFRSEELEPNAFPIVRGKSPLRISFSGGGTDLPNYFEKYGGVVISTTINKYCHGTARKRADSKIVIDSDFCDSEFVFDPRKMNYDGNFDLVKAVVKLMNPNFGLDLHLSNDIPPGRGLGSSASLAVLLAKLISQLQGVEYADSKVADIAYRAERDELGIPGGLQDQYAASTGGFNFMEFSKDRRIIYPLRLKETTIRELESHLTLCYVGKQHFSGTQQRVLERAMDEEEVALKLGRLKDIAINIKDILLTGNLQGIGELLHESWKYKREMSQGISNPEIDHLYESGIKAGASGGKLLGSGGGGYLLFYHPSEYRNRLSRALRNEGGEPMDFGFDSRGVEVWTPKE